MKHVRYAFIGVAAIALVLGAVAFVRMRLTTEQILPTPSPEVSSTANADIVVDAPLSGAVVSYPIEVSGKARGSWFFEASFPVRLETASGEVLMQTHAQALSDWMTDDFVPFTVASSSLETVIVATDTPLVLVVYNDNPSGLPQNDKEVRIPFTLMGQKTMHVNVFWMHETPNLGGMPNDYNCSDVVASERTVASTAAPARVVLDSLLSGPTVSEKQIGLFTNINPGVAIQKLSIQNGTAYVDFDKTLEQGVAGSCRVTAIRAQITKTLEQFPTVKNVVISIDGRMQDILQP